ncbi:MAG: hydantoinase/oxoprolinase family protein, partial [Jatrophihabitans sp.]
LKVGPKSAGAEPGPLCYGNGGSEVTVTDAHMLLGRIPPHLLGGEVPLQPAAARAGLLALAARLNLSPEACATGVLEISAWNQANALRQITVKRGLDVRDFVLTTFGGSGSLLLCRLVDILGLRAVLVPPNPGNVSAFGLLTVDVRNDYVQTSVARHDELACAGVERTFAELAGQAGQALLREGFPPEQHRCARTADLRYFGQAFEVRVPVPDGPLDQPALDAVAGAFHDAHRDLYGYDFRDERSQQVEWVNLRVTGIGPIRRPELPPHPARAGSPARALTGSRQVCFDDLGYLETPLYSRVELGCGDVITGPAVIEEFGSTVPLHPGFRAEVDRFGNLLVTRSDAERMVA